jgi:hypothetical protein
VGVSDLLQLDRLELCLSMVMSTLAKYFVLEGALHQHEQEHSRDGVECSTLLRQFQVWQSFVEDSFMRRKGAPRDGSQLLTVLRGTQRGPDVSAMRQSQV